MSKNTDPLPSPQKLAIMQEIAARNFKPGQTFQFSDGTTYRTTKSGAWQRLTSRRCSNSTNLKNNSVRRRLKSARTRV
jgi:hypothetical protein